MAALQGTLRKACSELFSKRSVACLPPLSVTREELRKDNVGRTSPFIINYESAERVAGALPGLARSTILEMSPGRGVLTRALLNAGAASLIAMEHNHRHFFPKMKVLEAEVGDTGQLSAVFCQWSRVDSEEDPTHPASLSSRALLTHLTPRPWQEDLIGYVVGVKQGAHQKGLMRYLMSVVSQDSVMMWGRWALAWLCNRRAVQKFMASPGSDYYGRIGIIAQSFCHIKSSLTIPYDHVYLRAKPSKPKNQDEASYHLLVVTPKADRPFDTVAECDFFNALVRQLTARMTRSIGNALMQFPCDGEAILKSLGIQSSCLVRSLSPDQFCSISRLLFACQPVRLQLNLP